MKKQIPYLLGLVGIFYILPLAIRNTGAAMAVMLIAMPVSLLFLSYYNGVKNGVNKLYLAAIPLLFFPTIKIFYNESAAIYIFVYFVFGLVGNLFGGYVNRRKG